MTKHNYYIENKNTNYRSMYLTYTFVSLKMQKECSSSKGRF